MPVAPVTYHWAMSPSSVINPHVFHIYTTEILLPAKHTLRRILLAETYAWWKRGSVGYDNQETYQVNYNVTYGNTELGPFLYRTTRRVPQVFGSGHASITEDVFSIHSAADLELGMNERCQRGGYYSEPTPLTLSWAIYSSGNGDEQLAGQIAMPFRALYSLPVAP